ncbi:hypothetical protein OPV22_010054 [Ensete ventricosum]|uniref:Uncharacterized protein n=1 Tax=Ensete ventricosum TaxID=4639 RepID=A0AAV8RKI2_ENSVE|nr:hypothetical protein OPV22_010054 [Ensete ventricosum]
MASPEVAWPAAVNLGASGPTLGCCPRVRYDNGGLALGRWRLAGEGRAATAHQGAAQAAVDSDARRRYSVADAGLSSPPVERTPWEELPRPCVVEVAGGSGLFPVEVAAERGSRRSHGGSRRDGLASHPGLLEPRDARPVAMALGTGGPRTSALVQCQCAGDHAAAVPQ